MYDTIYVHDNIRNFCWWQNHYDNTIYAFIIQGMKFQMEIGENKDAPFFSPFEVYWILSKV